MEKLYILLGIFFMSHGFCLNHNCVVENKGVQTSCKEFNNNTQGGLGGEIIKVINLNSSGSGSLREALEVEFPRIIVFEVGGVIDLEKTKLTIKNPFVTIAGQTAPYPGITIIKGSVTILTHDVVIQHISVRPGDAGQPKNSGWEPDGISIYGESAHHVLIDHCSVTWAVDENISVSGPRLLGPEYTAHHVTLSNNIIAEGLDDSSHSKGKHSKGSLVHDNCQGIAIVRNFYAHNADRNPYFKANTTGIIVNNLIYNPGSAAIRAGYVPSQWKNGDTPKPPLLSIVGNVLHLGGDSREGTPLIKDVAVAYMKENQSFDINGRKSKLAHKKITVLEKNTVWLDGLEVIPLNGVENSIIKNVGARPAERDPNDQRIVQDFINKKGKILDSQEEVGGYPTYDTTYRKLEVPSENIDQWLTDFAIKLEKK